MKHTMKDIQKLNKSTGEIFTVKQAIVSRSTIFFISINSSNYSKWLLNLKSMNHLVVALYIANNHDRNTDCFSTSINKYHIDKISSITHKSPRTIYRIIQNLIDLNIIKRKNQQLFANPYFFIKATNPKIITKMIEYYNNINGSHFPLSNQFD